TGRIHVSVPRPAFGYVHLRPGITHRQLRVIRAVGSGVQRESRCGAGFRTRDPVLYLPFITSVARTRSPQEGREIRTFFHVTFLSVSPVRIGAPRYLTGRDRRKPTSTTSIPLEEQSMSIFQPAYCRQTQKLVMKARSFVRGAAAIIPLVLFT